MQIETLKELGQTIKKARKTQCLTQKDLALTLGTSIRLIVELEKGERGVRIDTILKACKLLGLVIDISEK